MSHHAHDNERRALQVTLCVLALVPIGAGLAGAILGLVNPGRATGAVQIALDSHYRYLSGILFAVGVLYLRLAPDIERNGNQIRLLTALVFAGGLFRLLALVASMRPEPTILFALAMELCIAPLLALWQARIARVSPRTAPVRDLSHPGS